MEQTIKKQLKKIYLAARTKLLSALSAILRREKLANLDLAEIEKILVVRIDRIGDLVLSTPIFKNIKKAMPDCRLSVLANKTASVLLSNNPDVDDIIIYDPRRSIWKKIWGLLKLRSYHFDLAIDPYADYELKTALITALAGAKKSIGYPSHGRQFLFNLPAPELRSDRHFIEISLDLLAACGISATEKLPEIFLTKAERQWACQLLEAETNCSKSVIGIHPGAHYPSQRWPAEYHAQVIDQLRRTEDVEFILLGGHGDQDELVAVQSCMTGSICAHVTSDIRQFAAIASLCQILVCNNSGPLHVAAAVKTPTLSFCGPTNYDRWLPIGAGHRVLRIHRLECIGCQAAHCPIKTHDCMRLIKPAEVVAALKEMLSTGGAETCIAKHRDSINSK